MTVHLRPRAPRTSAARLFAAAVTVHALALPAARAQEAPASAPLTLRGAIQEAQRERPLLVAGKARAEAARARIGEARSGLLPRLDLQGSATDGPTGAPALGLGGLVGTPLKKHTGGSLNLVQTLLDFGRTHNLVRARREDARAAAELLQADRNRVTLEVEQSYLQALQSRRLLAVNRQILEQRQLVARQAATFFQNGLTSRVDVDLAEASVAQAQLAVVRSQNEIEIAFAALSTAVGHPIGSTTSLEDVVAAPTPTATLPAAPSPTPPAGTSPPATGGSANIAQLPGAGEAMASALRSRPELHRAASQVRAFEHLTSAAKAGKRPLLTGVASVGKVNPIPLFEASDKPWAVGLALTVPIFTGGLVEGQVAEARQNTAAARGDLNELTNVVRQQVTGALANLSASEESVRVAGVELVRTQDALSLSTRRYQTQLGSIVELTQAQVSYASAQNDFVRALYDRELAQAALAFATGQSDAYAATGSKP